MHTDRHYFLDCVRVLAFFLLIFYHTGLYYVTWHWHVKSAYAGSAVEPIMMLSSRISVNVSIHYSRTSLRSLP